MQQSDNTFSDEWRDSGLPSIHLATAQAVFATPDEAKPWIEVLIRWGINANALQAVISAGMTPDEVHRWREAGVDSRNIVPYSQTLSQAGLGCDDVVRWRRAGLFSSTLIETVPHLLTSRGTVEIDDVIEILETWGPQVKGGTTPRAEEMLRVLESGVGLTRLIELRRNGVSGEELLRWRSCGVPAESWPEWVSAGVAPESAVRFHAKKINPGTAQEWMTLGFSSDQSIDLIDRGVALSTAREFLATGMSASDATAFLLAGASLAEAAEWTSAGIAADEAATFMNAHVSLSEALRWNTGSNLTAAEVVDFIEKGVSLDQALDFDGRGISSGQVTRTESGLELDLDPWQEDPTDHLPAVITPGPIDITVWRDQVAHEVHFTWNGNNTADWYEDISIINNLSFASSSPTRGVLAWPDNKDVVLTYNWPEMGLEGHDRLAGLAPTKERASSSPEFWVSLAEGILEFVMENLGSRDPEPSSTYLDTKLDDIVDLDSIFRDYLDYLGSKPDVSVDFGGWLEESLASGRYELLDDE